MEHLTWDTREVEFRGCTENSFAFRVGVLGDWRNPSARAVSFPRAGFGIKGVSAKPTIVVVLQGTETAINP